MTEIGLLKKVSVLNLAFECSVHPGNYLSRKGISRGIVFAKASLVDLCFDLAKGQHLSLFHDFFAIFGQSLSEGSQLGWLKDKFSVFTFGRCDALFICNIVLHP